MAGSTRLMGASSLMKRSKRAIWAARWVIFAQSSAGVSRNRIELRSHFSGTMPFSRRKLARMPA
ncbi:hypothetical protein D9M73_224170 [compost metagenome]